MESVLSQIAQIITDGSWWDVFPQNTQIEGAEQRRKETIAYDLWEKLWTASLLTFTEKAKRLLKGSHTLLCPRLTGRKKKVLFLKEKIFEKILAL